MAPADPLPTGAPASAPNDIGAKVLNTLQSFIEVSHDLRRDISKLSSEITEVRIKSEGMDAKLSNMKESIDANGKQLDTLIEKASDMKSNITALGVKTNINILLVLGAVAGLITMFNNMITAINASRNGGSAPSTVIRPAPNMPGSTP